MSVLIKGMEMPTSCDDCPLIAEADDFHVCYINEQFIPWEWIDEHSAEQRHPKPSWCPLIEVPPHGRLIDADALHEELYGLEYVRENEWLDGVREARGVDAARVALLDAPTIIESEAFR